MTQEAPRQSPSKNRQTISGERPSPGEEREAQSYSSTLLEFPGSTRAIPEWRKQLSKRVREVQDRKAREAAEELAAAQEAGLVSLALPSGQLELVPDLEQPVMNPIVSKALERIDRARRSDYSNSQYTAAATAAAYAPAPDLFTAAETAAAPVVETKPRLSVVITAPPLVEPEIETIEAEPAEEMVEVETAVCAEREQIELVTETDVRPEVIESQTERRSVRVISENDPCLSYLETCLQVPALVDDSRQDIAGLWRRSIAGVFDLIFVALMVSPAAAAIYYSGAHWAEPRVIGVMSGITAGTMFAYLTLTTAMTGRTLAMRMFSLRTIDLRTGLIPTGGQSIKRALGHVVSVALAGLGFAYALIDPDRRTMHDRFSHTIVIRT